VGTFADPGFAGRPGLFQELFDAGEVFTEWCNDHGGINGRKIDLDEHDSALTNVKPEMTKACADDFVLVGGGAAFDQDGVDTRLQCLLPDIAAFTASPEARGADLQVQPLPNGLETWAVGDFLWLGRKYPESKDAVGTLAADVPAGKVTVAQSTEAVESLDWEVVYEDVFPAIGPPTWTPYAVDIQSAGVKGLIWVGEPEYLAKFLQALADIRYELDWVRVEPNHYDQLLVDTGGAAIRNVFIRSVLAPFEKADENPATRQLLDLFARYKPDGKSRAYLAGHSFSAWLLFAQAARACGNDLTRRCLYENAKKVTEWTGGGLHAETNPRSNRAPECFVMIEATPKGFTTPDIEANDGIYRCDRDGVYTLQRDYGQPGTLERVGRSISDLR
jgi:ABC-type branched-subunit amino acid transport system substrate-binding protein